MSILTDIGTKIGLEIKNLINRVITLENEHTANNYITFDHNVEFSNCSTTQNLITKLTELGCFTDNSKTFKATWSYANNSDLTDTGFGTVELAGCLIETWGGSNKNIRITRPTTGQGGEIILFYTYQGADYSPGWRQILTG